MYHSYQLYTRNTGLSYCILGMDNLTWYVHASVKYKLFWKIISIKNAFLNYVLLVSTFWHLREMSKFHVVHGELMLILLVGIKEQTGVVLKENRTVGFCKACKLVFPLIVHGSFHWFSCFLFYLVQSVR